LRTAFEVTCQGQSKFLAEWLKNQSVAAGPDQTVRDVVNAVGSVCLAPCFAEQAPEYPKFATLITSANRPQAAQEALRWLRGVTQTKQAAAVLDALELVDGDRLEPNRSRYARYILERLNKKGAGQVLNRSELLQDVQGLEYLAPESYRLEPEWVAVLLAALVSGGEVVLALPGKKLDSTAVDALSNTPISDLVDFKHVERPKDWSVPALRALVEILGLPSGLALDVTRGGGVADQAVQQIQDRIGQKVEEAVRAQQSLQDGLPFWGRGLLGAGEQAEIRSRLERYKAFLESFQPFSTPSKLKNLRYSADEIDAQKPSQATLAEVTVLQGLAADLGPRASYLAQAEVGLPGDLAWVLQEQAAKATILADVANPTKRNQPTFRQQTLQALDRLRSEYVRTYADLHTRARLGRNDDDRKKKLLADDRLARLKRLGTISLLPASQLTELQNRIAGLVSCFALTESELQGAPLCPHCGFKPATEPVSVSASVLLGNLDLQLDQTLASWTTMLLENLEDPTVEAGLKLLPPASRGLIADFLAKRELPANVTPELIQAVQDVLSGLTRVVVNVAELRAALSDGGAPATLADFKQRFDSYVGELTSGKDPKKVRVVIE